MNSGLGHDEADLVASVARAVLVVDINKTTGAHTKSRTSPSKHRNQRCHSQRRRDALRVDQANHAEDVQRGPAKDIAKRIESLACLVVALWSSVDAGRQLRVNAGWLPRCTTQLGRRVQPCNRGSPRESISRTHSSSSSSRSAACPLSAEPRETP